VGSETDRILTVKITVVEVAYYDTRIRAVIYWGGSTFNNEAAVFRQVRCWDRAEQMDVQRQCI